MLLNWYKDDSDSGEENFNPQKFIIVSHYECLINLIKIFELNPYRHETLKNAELITIDAYGYADSIEELKNIVYLNIRFRGMEAREVPFDISKNQFIN